MSDPVQNPQKPVRPPQQISAIMRRVKGRDTLPELNLRKELWRRGLRYRKYAESLPGKPDIVFPTQRLVIFVDGDFWHGNQWLRRGYASLNEQFAQSKTKVYWIKKIQANMERDWRNTVKLVEQGWRVFRFWESQVNTDIEFCVNKVAQALKTPGKELLSGGLPYRTFAEFFAGIGLMRIALEEHGWQSRIANDIDPQKYEMYSAFFPDDPASLYRVEDIHNLKGEDIPTVSLATASFPCTDLSLAGTRVGLKGKQSSALLGFLRILEEINDRRPAIVLLENVTGFLSSHGGEDFKWTLRQFNMLGYTVDAFILDAIHFVPQSRPRLFVIGIQESQWETPSGLLADEFDPLTRPPKLSKWIKAHPEFNWRILRLPSPPVSTLKLRDILQEIPHDSDMWWSHKRVEYLLNQMSDRHRKVAETMINSSEYKYGTVFRRIRSKRSMAELRVDGIAGCLRTPRGGSSRQILFKAGLGKCWARFLTPRECARLQGLPDSYKINVPFNQALFGFGDAVCVPLIEWIATNYLNVVINQILRGKLLSAH